MLDSIYHITLKLIKNRIFGMKTSFTQRHNWRHNFSRKSVNH